MKVGAIGDGQLGRLLALAGTPQEMDLVFLKWLVANLKTWPRKKISAAFHHVDIDRARGQGLEFGFKP